LKTQLSVGKVPVVMTSDAANTEATPKRKRPNQLKIDPVPDPSDGVAATDGGEPVSVARASLAGQDSSFAVRVASYNVLGSSHTAGRNSRGPGTYRIGLA